MGENITPSAAKGLYTFTTTEKIQYRHAVIASSWEEAREQLDQEGFRLHAGDHSGGEYMGESEPRRETLLRKQTCIIENLSLIRKVYVKDGYNTTNEIEKIEIYNPDHSDWLLYNPFEKANWGFHIDHDSGYYKPSCVKELNEQGICEHCMGMIDRGFEINALGYNLPIRKEKIQTVYYHRLTGFVDSQEKITAAIVQKSIKEQAERDAMYRRNPHCYELDGSSVGNPRNDGRTLINGAAFSNKLPTWVSIDCDKSEITKENVLDHVLETYDEDEGVWEEYS